MVSLGQGQGGVGLPTAPVPTVGLCLRGPFGAQGFGVPACRVGKESCSAVPGRSAGCLGDAAGKGYPKTHCNCVPAPRRAGRARGHVPPWRGGRNLVMVAGSSCGTGKCLGPIRALGPRASVTAGCISRILQWLQAAEPCPCPAVLGAANRPPGECPAGVPGSPGQLGACSCPVPPEAAPPSSSCSSCPPRQGGMALGCLWLWGPFPAQLGIPAHPVQAWSCQWLRAQLHLCSRPGDVCDRAGRWVLPLPPGVWGCKNPLSPALRPMHPGSACSPLPRHGLSLAGGDSGWAAEPAGRGQAVATQA